MTVDSLCDEHKGQLAWIVGTGPSTGVFPFQALKRLWHLGSSGHVFLGINQSYRHLPLDYGVTVKLHNRSRHAGLMESGEACPVGTWVVRDVPGKNEVVTSMADVYAFFAEEKKGGNWDALTARRPGELFYHGGSQTAALHLAALMGCSAAILIGNDMRSLGGEHWGHVREGPPQREDRSNFYGAYKLYTRELRSRLWQIHRMPVLTLTPFVGLDDVEEEYTCLKQLLKEHPLA